MYNKLIKNIGMDHAEVKKAIRLIKNKGADDERLFIIEGCWAYEKLIRSGIEIDTILVFPELIVNEKEKRIVESLVGKANKAYMISGKVSKRLSERDKPEGCFMICVLPKYTLNQISIGENSIIIVMDGLEKPGNIGTIMRTADAAGCSAVVVCNKKAKLTHSGVVKGSMGSSFTLPVVETTVEELAGWLEENRFKIFLTDLKARKSCYEADYSGRVAIVVGNEIRGISEEWGKYNCERIIIPMFGAADSLNVGFAAILIAYEAAAVHNKLRKI